ncbi:MAG: hypothetical protein QHH14_02170 [Clostridiales bacterium]|jgi:hypothetical protein|nr:hypothetical protein [Clostridiales bacterium]
MRKLLWGFFSLANLAVCLLSAVGYFLGKLQASEYKLAFLVASLGWFVFATLWAKHSK